MKDFFIAFSSSSAAIAGIIFAFLISKALGFESLQEEIMDEINKKIIDLKRINSKILNRIISSEIIETRKEEIELSYEKKLFADYDNWIQKEEEFLMDYLLKAKIYYLDIDECLKKLKEIGKSFLKNEYEKMKKYIEEMPRYKLDEIAYLDKLEDTEKFKFLNKISQIEYKSLNDLFEYKKAYLESYLEGYARGAGIPKPYYPTPDYDSEAKEIENNIASQLVEFEYKNEEINHLYKKINNLKTERTNLTVFLGIAYTIVIIGVIYPLSYVKYKNEDILDYSLKNFFLELFSWSGVMLAILYTILTYFTFKIYKAIELKKELDMLKKDVSKIGLIKAENYIIRNMERCQEFEKNKII